MPRDLDALNTAQTSAVAVAVAFFLQITFKSMTCYVSTLPFNYTWNSQTWTGTGSLAKVGAIQEGTEVQAYGMQVSLSGIDPVLLPEAMTDIALGQTATLYMAFFDVNLNVIGSPFPVFAGQVDKPSIQASTDTCTISLNLESPMIRLQQGSFRKLTDADQRMMYPNDSSMGWTALLNFQALAWGT